MTWTLVAGGSSPLGKEICKKLINEGYPVLIHYFQNFDKIQSLIDGNNVQAIQGDFSTQQGVDAFLEKLIPFSIENFIYNTGPYGIGNLADFSLNEWQVIYQLNFWAPVAIIQSIAPSLCQHQGSVITFGVAGIGKNRANSYNASYVNAKEALWHITRCFAKEFASRQVRVNMIAPGHLETSSDLSLFQKSQPTGKPVPLIEIAELSAFLLSKHAKNITGQLIEVSGGAFL